MPAIKGSEGRLKSAPCDKPNSFNEIDKGVQNAKNKIKFCRWKTAT